MGYNDQLVVGLDADAGLIPDIENFLELFTEGLKSFQAFHPTGTPNLEPLLKTNRLNRY
jgi:hypothetical protein